MLKMSYQKIVLPTYNFVVADTETTGLDARTSSLIEIGAVQLLPPENNFSGLCNVAQGAEVSEEALRVTVALEKVFLRVSVLLDNLQDNFTLGIFG